VAKKNKTMAFKMKGSSMHKGTKAHKDALSAFKAAEESSLKSTGVYETYFEDGEVKKRRIPKEQFLEQYQAQVAAGENPAINVGGTNLNQEGRVNEYVLTGGDINLAKKLDLERADIQAPGGLVKTDTKQEYYYPGTGSPVTPTTDISGAAQRDKDRMDRTTGPLDFNRKEAILEGQGIDRGELLNFIENLDPTMRARLTGNKQGNLGDIKNMSKLDKLIQTFVNQGGKVTKGQGKLSQSAVSSPVVGRNQGTSN